jgi:hypothetical protein
VDLFDPDDQNDDLSIDMDDADTQELEAIAYRFTQIIPESCEVLAKALAQIGINHPVIFLCDVADPFGLAIARKITSPDIIERSLKETRWDERPGVIDSVDLDDLEGKEPTIFHAVKGRMTGLIGYFPIIVAAKGGFSVFPWPYKLKEKSKFKLFSRT